MRLENEQADAYLRRAYQCVGSEYQFSHLPLLCKMLEIEAAFIKRMWVDEDVRKLANGNRLPNVKNLAKVNIGLTGLPELHLWLTDLSAAVNQADTFRKDRARAFLPLRQQFLNISPKGIEAETTPFLRLTGKDSELLSVIAPLTGDQREFLRLSPELKAKRRFPIHEQKEYPTLLIIEDRSSPFHPRPSSDGKYEGEYGAIDKVPIYAGVKYIDFPLTPILNQNIKTPTIRTPVLVYFVLGNNWEVVAHWALTPHIGLTAKNYNPSKTISVLSLNQPQELDQQAGESLKHPDEVSTINSVNKFRNLSGEFTLLFIETDFARLPPEQVQTVFQVLLELDNLASEYVKIFTTFVIDGNGDEKTVEKDISELKSKLLRIFNQLPDDSLRNEFQNAWAKRIGEVR